MSGYCPYTGEPYCEMEGCPDWGACGVDKIQEDEDADNAQDGI